MTTLICINSIYCVYIAGTKQVIDIWRNKISCRPFVCGLVLESALNVLWIFLLMFQFKRLLTVINGQDFVHIYCFSVFYLVTNQNSGVFLPSWHFSVCSIAFCHCCPSVHVPTDSFQFHDCKICKIVLLPFVINERPYGDQSILCYWQFL